MKHALDINKQTALSFVRKAQEFLGLPRKLWQCDIDRCNPNLYKGALGKAAIKRARAGSKILKRVDADIKKIIKLLS